MHVLRALAISGTALTLLSLVGPARADQNETSTGSPASASISTGGFHSCAVLVDETVSCWGFNPAGQVGDGTATNRPSPVRLGLTGVVAVSAGAEHTCALLAIGHVDCWGNNIYGALGTGDTVNRATPTPVPGLTNVVAISSGGYHTCALIQGGTIRCWGLNGDGELGDGSTTNRTSPVTVLNVSTATSVSGGGNHTCALLLSGSVRCWGFNGAGRLGDSTTVSRPLPTAVTGITHALAISAGQYDTCAVMQGGTVRCWGPNFLGTIGDGTKTDRSTPTLATGVANAVGVTVGSGHACALLAAGTVTCWGDNDSGQVGDGTTAPVRLTAGPAAGLGGVIAIAAANGHTCAVKTDSTVRCWGANTYGQLGYGDTEDRGGTAPTLPGFLPALPLAGAVRTGIPAAAHRATAHLTSNHPKRDRTSPYAYSLAGVVTATGAKSCSGMVTVRVRYRTKVLATVYAPLRSTCHFSARVAVSKKKLLAALPKSLRKRTTPVSLGVTIAYAGNNTLTPATTTVTLKAR